MNKRSPIHDCPEMSGLYPLSQIHLYEPIMFKHRPFLHRSFSIRHSSISEIKHTKDLIYQKTKIMSSNDLPSMPI